MPTPTHLPSDPEFVLLVAQFEQAAADAVRVVAEVCVSIRQSRELCARSRRLREELGGEATVPSPRREKP